MKEVRKYSFEKLDVWKLSKSLTVEIYKLSTTFPTEEKFGITSQIRRASFSVNNNLAEGNSRNSTKEKIRFIEIAFGSLMEVLNILIIIKDLDYINSEQLLSLRKMINEIGNKLNSLKNAINK